MQIIILDSHPLPDRRINRHIGYMREHGYELFRLNIDRSLSYKHSGMAPSTSIPCYVIGCAYTRNNTLNKICYNIQRFVVNNEDIDSVMTRLGVSYQIPTVVHVHDPVLLPFAVKIYGRLQHAKLVYDRHEVYESRIKHFSLISLPKIARFSEILTANYIDGVVTILEEYRCVVEKMFPRSEIAVVPNFPVYENYDDKVILSKIENVSRASVIHFVYIGSLSWDHDRDIGLILYLAESLLSNNYNVKFTVGGQTSDEKLLSEFSRLSAIYPDKFIYAGYLSPDLVIQHTQIAHFGFLLIKPNTHYWVLTSPNKVFEYLRCGVIPILRAKCSCKIQLQNNSIWFEREDSKELILEKIKSIIQDPDKIHDMMLLSYRLSSHFSYESVAHEYLCLYNAI